MDTSYILDYLSALSANNNREWYHAHKAEYKAANAEFEALIQALIFSIGEFDPSVLHNAPQTLTFKLNRDTRFSHDKSPYNPAFRAHISSMGKLPVPVGYYLMIKPGEQSFLGGGLFADMRQLWYGTTFPPTVRNGSKLSMLQTSKSTSLCMGRRLKMFLLDTIENIPRPSI